MATMIGRSVLQRVCGKSLAAKSLNRSMSSQANPPDMRATSEILSSLCSNLGIAISDQIALGAVTFGFLYWIDFGGHRSGKKERRVAEADAGKRVVCERCLSSQD